MAKKTPTTADAETEVAQAETGATPAQKEIPMSLTEFCTRLSRTERRYLLISAFDYEEKKAGRLRDTFSAYQQRFNELIRKPVGGK